MISQLDATHIEMVLQANHIARLGCHANGRTYIVPVTYSYKDNTLYGHTNPGLKVDMLRANPQVCVEVEQIESMANWRTIIAWGQYEELHGQEEADALDLLIRSLTPFDVSDTFTPLPPEDGDAVYKAIKLRPRKGITYRIRLGEKTGRYEARHSL